MFQPIQKKMLCSTLSKDKCMKAKKKLVHDIITNLEVIHENQFTIKDLPN